MKRITKLLIVFMLILGSAFAQSADQKQKPADTGDVVQLGTTVVQTDLTVFGKDGHFVDNLKRDQFELYLDGKLQPISFFDLITAGTSKEEVQLATARGEKTKIKQGETTSREIGRTIFFFVDDFHLSAESVMRTRKILTDYVNNEANSNDKVAVLTTSGQLGFLQQLCDNKAVLRAAINRLIYREPSRIDRVRPEITEGQAIDIERNDTDVLNALTLATLREDSSFSPTATLKSPEGIRAQRLVMARAKTLVERTSAETITTLLSLQNFLSDVAELPGRKIVFYISDGFLVQNTRTDIVNKLQQVINRAALAGVVFYTIDARGLTTGLPDASSTASADPTSQALRGLHNEVADAQDGLNSLAVDTGGRMIRNTNALGVAVTNVLSETSQYYVLAWQWNSDRGL